MDSWWTRFSRKCFWARQTSVFKLLLLKLYLLHFFHQGVNPDSFIPEVDFSFLSILKYDLYIRIGILKGRKWQKCFSLRHISKFQLIFLEKCSAVNSCIRFWIYAFIILQDSCIEESLVLFLTLASIIPSRSPSTPFLTQKWIFLENQLLYVQSLISVPPWRKLSQSDCAFRMYCPFYVRNSIYSWWIGNQKRRRSMIWWYSLVVWCRVHVSRLWDWKSLWLFNVTWWHLRGSNEKRSKIKKFNSNIWKICWVWLYISDGSFNRSCFQKKLRL